MSGHEKKLREIWRELRAEYPKLQPYSFKLDGRSSRRLGVCKFRTQEIMIAKRYVEDPEFPFEELEDTLRHEVAHVLAGPRERHGKVWQAHAVAVGARPTACADSEAAKEGYKKLAKWRIWCDGPCEYEGFRHRLVKKYKRWITHPGKCRCGGNLHAEERS